jgi:hypothetical protein
VAAALTDAVLDEADAISALLDVAAALRESVKRSGGGGAASAADERGNMQDLMKEMQDASFTVQTAEAARTRLTSEIAAALGCEPVLSAIAKAAGGGALLDAGGRLKHAVLALKSEMLILGGLIEQNERFGAMLLSEWRRVNMDFSRSGVDLKG